MQLSAIRLSPLIVFAALARAIPQPPRATNTGMPYSVSESDLRSYQDGISDSIGYHSCVSHSQSTNSQPALMGIEDRLSHTTSNRDFLEFHGNECLSSSHLPSRPPPKDSVVQRHSLRPALGLADIMVATALQIGQQVSPGMARAESFQRKPQGPIPSGKKLLRSQSLDIQSQISKLPRKRPPRRSPFERRANVLSVSKGRVVRSIRGH